MKIALIILSLVAALITANPLPQAPAPAATNAPALAGLPNPFEPGPAPTPDAQQGVKGQACPDAVNTMAAGIQQNIDRNDPETGVQQALLQVLLQSPIPDADPMRFDPEKMSMTGFLNQDIQQTREVLAAMPKGNPATAGLNQVNLHNLSKPREVLTLESGPTEYPKGTADGQSDDRK